MADMLRPASKSQRLREAKELAIMSMDAIKPGKTAVITGGAAGIGLAAAHRFAQNEMNIVMIDVRDELFDNASKSLRDLGAPQVVGRKLDVADKAMMNEFATEVHDRFGGADVLMCNAGIQPGSDIFDTAQTWDRIMSVNLGGVITCCQAFVPHMVERDQPGMVINTGSKQGITAPPGDPAYNTAKAGVKTFTEALEHHLRETEAKVSAHLLIPGFVFTDLTRRGRTEKPDGAWTPGETVDFMMDSLAKGDFYILCPDNDVTRALDEKRMAWAMGDIIENRPPLSRWHKDWGAAFEEFVNSET
jgi:NAD(P)-dependent dehydrogenase (short-subunit alcohol dehydrogenase family)